jgi:hypothetical protein
LEGGVPGASVALGGNSTSRVPAARSIALAMAAFGSRTHTSGHAKGNASLWILNFVTM